MPSPWLLTGIALVLLVLVGQVVTLVVLRRERKRSGEHSVALTHLRRKADDTHRHVLGIGKIIGVGDDYTETKVMDATWRKR